MIDLLTMKGWFFVGALAFSTLAVYQVITYYKNRDRMRKISENQEETIRLLEGLKNDNAVIYREMVKIAGDIPH